MQALQYEAEIWILSHKALLGRCFFFSNYASTPSLEANNQPNLSHLGVLRQAATLHLPLTPTHLPQAQPNQYIITHSLHFFSIQKNLPSLPLHSLSSTLFHAVSPFTSTLISIASASTSPASALMLGVKCVKREGHERWDGRRLKV